MNEVYIYDAVRTPRGKARGEGKHRTVRPVHLASHVLKSIITRQELESQVIEDEIEDIILGCVTQIGEQGGCIAKAAALEAGLPYNVSGLTINRFCASGLEAVNLAAARIKCDQNNLLIAGGVESMSRVPMGNDGGALMMDPHTAISGSYIPQGVSADLIANLNRYSRRDLDQWAVRSHEKAAYAQDQGYFKNSLVPLKNSFGKSYLAYDEMVRASTNMEDLAKLKPSFSILAQNYGFKERALKKYPHLENIESFHHPGNSSSLVDGASAVLLGNLETGKKYNLKPRAKIRAWANVGTEPTIMLTGPAPATLKALEKADLGLDDVDLFEVNEAFASVVLKFIDDLKIPEEKVNVNGGAIALGHPLGATGAMLVGTLVDELERRDQRIGVVTLCIGGGMGIATVIERVN